MARTEGRPGASPALLSLVTATVAVVGVWAALATVDLADAERSESATSGRATPTCAAATPPLTTPSQIGTIPLSRTQIENAETIVATAFDTGRTPDAATIALATAMQESTLLNVPHGDEVGPDSRGLFQQRLRYFGHIDVMDPIEATTAFLDQLDDVDGWEELPPHEAIQTVQRAAHPERYADWIEPAREWTEQLWPRAATCAAAAGFASTGP
jgi:hypothetical protein